MCAECWDDSASTSEDNNYNYSLWSQNDELQDALEGVILTDKDIDDLKMAVLHEFHEGTYNFMEVVFSFHGLNEYVDNREN